MVYLIIFLAVLARFIPHVWNFSPVYGALLFGGARLKKHTSLWFPTLLLGISDVILSDVWYHIHIGWREAFQLAAFAAIPLCGWSLRKRFTAARFGASCFAGPTAFYFISNFGVWLGWHTYPATWDGLIQCYVAGIPFYGYSLASTSLFAGILFGLFEYFQLRQTQRHHAALRVN